MFNLGIACLRSHSLGVYTEKGCDAPTSFCSAASRLGVTPLTALISQKPRLLLGRSVKRPACAVAGRSGCSGGSAVEGRPPGADAGRAFPLTGGAPVTPITSASSSSIVRGLGSHIGEMSPSALAGSRAAPSASDGPKGSDTSAATGIGSCATGVGAWRGAGGVFFGAVGVLGRFMQSTGVFRSRLSGGAGVTLRPRRNCGADTGRARRGGSARCATRLAGRAGGPAVAAAAGSLSPAAAPLPGGGRASGADCGRDEVPWYGRGERRRVDGLGDGGRGLPGGAAAAEPDGGASEVIIDGKRLFGAPGLTVAANGAGGAGGGGNAIFGHCRGRPLRGAAAWRAR